MSEEGRTGAKPQSSPARNGSWAERDEQGWLDGGAQVAEPRLVDLQPPPLGPGSSRLGRRAGRRELGSENNGGGAGVRFVLRFV